MNDRAVVHLKRLTIEIADRLIRSRIRCERSAYPTWLPLGPDLFRLPWCFPYNQKTNGATFEAPFARSSRCGK